MEKGSAGKERQKQNKCLANIKYHSFLIFRLCIWNTLAYSGHNEIPKIVHSRRSFREFISYTDLSDDEIPMEDIIQQSEDNIQAIKKSPIRSPLKIPKGRYGKRKIRCKKCEGCTSEDCGVCNYCLYVNFGHPLPLFMGRWAPGFLYRTALGLLRTINLFSLHLVCQHCNYSESSFALSDLNLAFLACPSTCKQFSPAIHVL